MIGGFFSFGVVESSSERISESSPMMWWCAALQPPFRLNPVNIQPHNRVQQAEQFNFPKPTFLSLVRF